MFGFMVWLVIGGIIGWLASVVMRTDKQQGILANIVAGVIGSYIGGAFLAPIFHADPFLSYLSAFFGGVFVVVAISLLTRGRLP
jgi:uncharacterized membrane protein YeaQ/YmgE (transglycosylase-associated protein family)